jgi:hypothetical protein
MAQPKRKRGRPRQDDEDQVIVDIAAALAKVYGLGPQKARDLALAWKEGCLRQLTPEERKKLARRFQRPGVVTSFNLLTTCKGRESGIAKKLAGGKLKPRPEVVQFWVCVLDSLRQLKPGVAPAPHFFGEIEN